MEPRKELIGCICYEVHSVQSVLNNNIRDNFPSIPARVAQFAILQQQTSPLPSSWYPSMFVKIIE